MHQTTQRLFDALQAVAQVDAHAHPSKAARYLDESPAVVANWRLRGVSKGGMLKACAKLGINSHWLATGEGEMLRWESVTKRKDVGNTPTAAKTTDTLPFVGYISKGRLVPVAGKARLRNNGSFEDQSIMNSDESGFVEAYSADPHAFAIKAEGDQMFPIIRDGWFIIVEPSSIPEPGDLVVIKLADGSKMIKELLMSKADSIVVHDVAGGNRTTLRFDELDPVGGLQTIASFASPRKWQAT